ncbi:KAP family P-loop NTPase fold protein [Glaciecola petra]|uniref:P-loop NTPase fold protein n=1 Tax=Glaciecola petra TaxID=3075602 RepID=A0ABU2ZSH8_9ALTE|nr:P-loop NTPase fold protein [Aestuariibacter sp. P117]MDT0595588.1 P-loop NTPase fold protein [Aestuariibacter sp. P117]
MNVDKPQKKGLDAQSFDAQSFEKSGGQTQSDDMPDAGKLVKQPFPIKQFLFACLSLLIGALLFWVLSTFASLDPDPLKQDSSRFKIASFNYLIERNAPLRLPLINSDVSISHVGSVAKDLALRFEDGRQVLISKQDEQSKSPYSAVALNTSDNSYIPEPLVLEFNASREGLDGQQTNQLDSLLQRISEAGEDASYSIRIYAFSNPSESQEVQSSLDEAVSAFIQPIKRPFNALTSVTSLLQTRQDKMPSSLLKIALNSKLSEPDTQTQKEAPIQDLEQNTAPPVNPNDYTRVSNILLLQKVLNVSNYLRSGLLKNGTVVQINTDNTVLSNLSLDLQAGVVVEFSSVLPPIDWSDSIKNIANFEINTQAESREKFQIVNNDIVNVIHADSTIETIAILPSALQRFYGNGNNYAELSPKSYPSLLSLAVLFAGIFGALYILSYRPERPDADIIKKQLLVDSFVSDAPASNLSQDRLGFAEISTALSRFLRNAGTKAPLTLAITGAWGSGKSSLMYFLKENLLQFHMQPVWVNAWHHQNEEQFLAGLLNAVRRNAIPPFWSSAGLLYRWNLLKMRWHDAPFFYYSFAFIFLASLTFILTADTSLPTSSNQISFTSIPFLSALIAALPILNAGMDKISSLSRASLVQTLLKGGKQGLDLRANLGLREKFATEFGMLCDALGDSTLTIFIDDLDRCKESRIMDVMETINYLVSSGNCFIVIAMERDPVEKAIESYYKSTYSELDANKLKIKARRYLEKIINIEIPVPNANEEQFKALVKVKGFEAKTSKLKWIKQFVVVGSLVVSIILGYVLASAIEAPQPIPVENDTEQAVVDGKSPNGESPNGESPDINAPADPSKSEEQQNIVPTEVTTPLEIGQNRSQNRSEVIIIPLLLIVAIGMLIRTERYRQRKRIVETDSEPFLVAISIWARVMGMSNKTPRSIKRFVNRTRFLAMRNAESETNIKEENLVTLAALIDIAKDKGLSDFDDIDKHLPPINNADLMHQVSVLIQKCHAISAEKRAQLQRWIRGFNVS